MFAIASIWLLGLVLGMRHATEPDHLAAVSTLLAEERTARRAALLGAFWGLGHLVTLTAVGGTLLVLRLRLPPWTDDAFECGVSLMLLGLGARSLWLSAVSMRKGPETAHRHGPRRHAHPGDPDHVHVGPWALGRGPLLVGLAHGLAGSGALTALALAAMPSLGHGLAFIACFGLGSLTGMALLTAVLGWSVLRVVQTARARAILIGASGALSVTLGAVLTAPIALRLLRG